MRIFYLILDLISFFVRAAAALSAIDFCDRNGQIFGIPSLAVATAWSVIFGLLMFLPEIRKEINDIENSPNISVRYPYAREIDGGKHFDFGVDYSNPLDPLVHGTPADPLN